MVGILLRLETPFSTRGRNKTDNGYNYIVARAVCVYIYIYIYIPTADACDSGNVQNNLAIVRCDAQLRVGGYTVLRSNSPIYYRTVVGLGTSRNIPRCRYRESFIRGSLSEHRDCFRRFLVRPFDRILIVFLAIWTFRPIPTF